MMCIGGVASNDARCLPPLESDGDWERPGWECLDCGWTGITT